MEKTESWWLWRGAVDKEGYRVFNVGDKKMVLAHKFSLELEKGKIRKKYVMRYHECKNRNCVRASHLTRDRTEKTEDIPHLDLIDYIQYSDSMKNS